MARGFSGRKRTKRDEREFRPSKSPVGSSPHEAVRRKAYDSSRLLAGAGPRGRGNGMPDIFELTLLFRGISGGLTSDFPHDRRLDASHATAWCPH
jgi:hypothetical protein